MRVLGIDPGSRITGLGIVSANGDELTCVYKGEVKMAKASLAERLKCIYAGVFEAVKHYQPDVVAIEKVFMAKNANSALVLGHARGAAICAAVNAGLMVGEYSALQIKQAVVGTGAADKNQVQHMVRVLLGLTSKPPSDAADALACAICHINTSRITQKLALQGYVQ
ncbi:MAG: crossover junction endodeoxyribonuclease RuvC [Parasphingorhabdus sp.]